ncbi:MAG: hypothetical protein IJH05_07960 [Firmicutes bacterium]|nr:hypothetical protein [Bacillota bacterium]
MLFCPLGLFDLIPVLIGIGILFRIVCRWFIFRKMGTRPWLSLFPIIREFLIFKKCWKVWPFLVLLALSAVFGLIVQVTAYFDVYMPIPHYIKSNLFALSIICLIILTILMYKHLAFAFGHDIGYLMGLLFLNPIFLGMMAFSKNTYHEELAKMTGKEAKEYTEKSRTLRNRILSVVSALVIVGASVGYVAYYMYTEQQPPILINKRLADAYEKTNGKVSGKGKVIYPAAESTAAEDHSIRDHYFPDKSHVKETTVYMYLVGSDLEDTTGSASINLAQIKDATAAGDKLTFIIEAGGTGRWFTDGFKNNRTARYMIKDGEVTLLDTLPSNTSMSDQKTLQDFLIWANNNYSSDRKMLVFWDHGGGFSGFGADIVNPGEKGKILSMDAITRALRASGQKYDVIAFDACLMQTMEVGQCLEPFADYLLASEESEPGSGLYYTAAFSRLAQDPTLDTLKFGAMMCSSYDQSLKLLTGTPQVAFTLSMVDLRYIPSVQETFFGYLDRLDREFRTDKNSFAKMSSARSKAYEFQMEDQIDMIDFIEMSELTAARKDEMISKVEKSIAVRSAASANHINGLAVYMPYDDLYSYSNLYPDMLTLGMSDETEVYNDFASIIGSQRTTKDDPNYGYYKDEAWFIDDFEDYNASLFKQDIPLLERGDGYVIDLSEEEKESIISYEQGVRMKIGSRYADLGTYYVFDDDGDEDYDLNFNGKWVSINGAPAALHPGTIMEAEDGTVVYSGTVDATLNFMIPITIFIEWPEDGGQGTVIGYLPKTQDSDDIDESGMPRGIKQFKGSNIITLTYDWYDKEGNYLSTALGHLPINVGLYGLEVTQEDISDRDYEYYGVLHDVLNRTLKTEIIKHEKQ